MFSSSTVIGLGFGDEGKGLATSFLCQKYKNPLVVRFNGGHQAGHTVVTEDGFRHVFSNLGSGTLQGVPTYWSEYCTFHPTSFLNEREIIGNKMVKIPVFYIHPLSPVTTPFDILRNRLNEEGRNPSRRIGSVGVGFGTTIERQEKFYKLHVQDLRYPKILKQKLRAIAGYYFPGHSISELNEILSSEKVLGFLKDCEEVLDKISIRDYSVFNYYTPIYEGAQGVLLDMDFGFFPNVTRSNTTSKNAIKIQEGLGSSISEIYYITRSYLTRHGNGYFPDSGNELKLVNNEKETNVKHDYQGEFRTTHLDVDLINYAIDCDSIYSKNITKNLIITCMDQHQIDVEDLLRKINQRFGSVYISEGDTIDKIKKIK